MGDSDKEAPSQPVMISAADLKELFALKEQLDAVKADLVAAGKLAAKGVAIGEAPCPCKGCNAKSIEPGAPGYEETKNADGELVPFMAAGTHSG